jgi:hypothetical protein
MFKARIPSFVKSIEGEYLKWAGNTIRYRRLYPVSAKIMEHLVENEGKYHGTTEKRDNNEYHVPHHRKKLKRGELVPEDCEFTEEYSEYECSDE